MYTEPGDKWLECSPSEGIEGLCFTVSSIGVSNLPEQPNGAGASWGAASTGKLT